MYHWIYQLYQGRISESAKIMMTVIVDDNSCTEDDENVSEQCKDYVPDESEESDMSDMDVKK